MSTIDKIDALLEFIQDTKPFSTKVLDTTLEYRHEEHANVLGDDTVVVDVTRTNNDFDINRNPIALRFYQPYDRVEAFEYSEGFNVRNELIRSTVKQNKITNRTQNYVVAKADIELTPFAVSSSPQYNPYVIFRVDALNVPQSEFALGIIAIDNYQTRLPCMDPVNNRYPVGYFVDDVGFKADGTILTNNTIDVLSNGILPVNPSTVMYNTGDYIKIELDYTSQKIYFYNITTSIPVFLGEYTIPDVNKTYAFACSMLNSDSNTEVSIVPPPPPPPYFNLLQTEFQNQTIICDNVIFEVLYDTQGMEDMQLYVMWEQVDPDTNAVLPLLHGARVDLYSANDNLIDTFGGTQYSFSIGDRTYLDVYYNTDNHQDRKFKITVFLNPGQTSQYFMVNSTPNDAITYNGNVEPPIKSITSAVVLPGSTPTWVRYNYVYPTTNPNTWYQGYVVPPLTNDVGSSFIKITFDGNQFPSPLAAESLSRVTELRLYRVGATTWDDQYVMSVFDNNQIVGPFGNGVYRVDTVYKYWTDNVEYIMKGTNLLTITHPTNVINVCDVLNDITSITPSHVGISDILHYTLIQIDDAAIDTIVYAPNQMTARGGLNQFVFENDVENDTIPQPKFTNKAFKRITKYTSGNIGG